MRHLLILLEHLIITVFRLVRSGGVRAVVAESVLAQHQLLVINRSRRRAESTDHTVRRIEPGQLLLGGWIDGGSAPPGSRAE